MTRWQVEQGDLLDSNAEGLICSANPHLNLSGGVGGAFGLRYGDEMQTFLHGVLRERGVPFLSPGQSVVAPPCGSTFKAVAHAVSIDGFYDTDVETILRTYDGAIKQLAEVGCKSIAAACLGCGYGRVSEKEFAAVSRVLFLRRYRELETVTLITTNGKLAEVIQQVLEKVTSG